MGVSHYLSSSALFLLFNILSAIRLASYLGETDVVPAEVELAIQVRDFDSIQIEDCHVHEPSLAQVLDQLAPDSADADYEHAAASDLLVELYAVELAEQTILAAGRSRVLLDLHGVY